MTATIVAALSAAVLYALLATHRSATNFHAIVVVRRHWGGWCDSCTQHLGEALLFSGGALLVWNLVFWLHAYIHTQYTMMENAQSAFTMVVGPLGSFMMLAGGILYFVGITRRVWGKLWRIKSLALGAVTIAISTMLVLQPTQTPAHILQEISNFAKAKLPEWQLPSALRIARLTPEAEFSAASKGKTCPSAMARRPLTDEW